ncbi:MAG TPA: recombinase family protein [Solirubrobacteraceae bacterium]|nr:recombinase family protein [Solirubrobacteraceae bacterium]
MSRPEKISAAHLERVAVVYVRQSTLAQVRQHTESTQRQYALAAEAERLGWPAARVEVIDDDLGLSGRSADGRSGFRELVGRVCVGEVGAILGLEVSRLARSSADLQRLLELARLTDTLVIDADGIYDLADFNDRLLLGLKGTMSEAELHLLAGRLQGAKLAAAERGELRFPLPVGLVYDDEGQTVIDPDEEVRSAVADVFAAFEQTGSAYGVVGAFEGRRFPRRAYGGAWAGELRWGRLTHSRALGVLSNPAYAGAYVYGRYRSRRLVDPDGTIRATTVELPRSEWAVVIHDHHPGYIDWETFLRNQARLQRNRTNAGERPPREGEALLQGILLCSGCGRQMSTRYQAGRGYYECSKSRADHVETPRCRSVRSDTLDEAVARRLLDALSPDEVALALAAADEVQQRRVRSTRAAELAVERARYEADRAERAFHACEPEHRLVARSLEQRWEARLAALAEAEQALTQAKAAVAPLPPPAELEALCADLPGLWAAPTTSNRDRKRILRTLIADVTLISEPGAKQLGIGIRWQSGASEQLAVERPPRAQDARRTPAAAVELARRRGPELTNHELAAELNAAGQRTGTGRPFDLDAVQWLRWRYRIPAPPPLAAGEFSVRDVARRLGVSDGVVYYWIARGQLDARRGPAHRLYIPFPPEVEQACRERVANSVHIKSPTEMIAAGGAV